MSVVVALARGVNLGSRTLRSDDLRTAAERAGGRQVATYRASGNAVAVVDVPPEAFAAELTQRLAAAVGFDVPVLVRDLESWDAAVAALPFVDQAAAQPSRTALACFDGPVGDLSGFDPDRYLPDEVAWSARDAYLWYPDGQARTRLTMPVLDRAAGRGGTARNWSTVLALADLAHRRAV